jgi:hypothetical protein
MTKEKEIEEFLKKRIKETKKELKEHRDNFGNNEVSYMFSLIAYREILGEFNRIKGTDFRFKKQKIKGKEE